MSGAAVEEYAPEYVSLTFHIKFLKNEVVTAPDGSLHPLTIKCLKPNFTGYPPVTIGPLGQPGQHRHDKFEDHKIAEASEGRALLGAAIALFDAQLANILAGRTRREPPPDQTETC